ncbi:MAG: hypothetical protein AAGC63_05785 [Propionicimonas sp.]|nr:hypothetical protein [Propionicimonas sp.]
MSGRMLVAVAGGFVGGLVVGGLLGWFGAGIQIPGPPVVPSGPATPAASPEPAPTPSVLDPFPTADTTGVPDGWHPAEELTGDLTVWDDGAVLEDLRLTGGTLYVRAANVTLRRVELVDARVVNDYGRDCFNGLRIEDSSFVRADTDLGMPVIQAGGYTLARVKMDGPSEGARVGELALGCGPVLIEDSWLRIAPPERCVADEVDWHGDGVQGYEGPELTVRNTAISLEQVDGCPGTAAFFYPDQGNSRAVVDRVLLSGGGYVFRLGTPGTVDGLKIVDDSWEYAPVDVLDCRRVEWGADNEIVARAQDGSLRAVEPLECAGA